MLPHPTSAPQPPSLTRIGVGLDTSRNGHYAVFLRDDLQLAAAELAFAESAAGYAQLRHQFEQITQRAPSRSSSASMPPASTPTTCSTFSTC